GPSDHPGMTEPRTKQPILTNVIASAAKQSILPHKKNGLLRRKRSSLRRREGGKTMDDQQRRDAGMTQRRKVLGDAWVDKSIANRNSFNAEFVDLITRHAWADIWTRP